MCTAASLMSRLVPLGPEDFFWGQKLLFLKYLVCFVGCGVGTNPQTSSACCSWKTAVKREEIDACVFACVRACV